MREIVPRNSYLLLDQTVIQRLADAYLSEKRPLRWARDFFREVQDKRLQLLICDLNIFEFLRGSKSLSERNARLDYLWQTFQSYLAGIELADIIDATLIANIYQNKNACANRSPSFVDLFLVTVLKSLPANVVLVTFNHKDFPTLFLDRLVQAIDLSKEIENLCFYRFDSGRFKRCLADYLKSEHKRKK